MPEIRSLPVTICGRTIEVPALNLRLASRHAKALAMIGGLDTKEMLTSEEMDVLVALVSDDLRRLPGQDDLTADWLLDTVTPRELGVLLGALSSLALHGEPPPNPPLPSP
jgi:hypothetical protein